MTVMTPIDPLTVDLRQRRTDPLSMADPLSLIDDAPIARAPLVVVFPLIVATAVLLWFIVANLIELASSMAPFP